MPFATTADGTRLYFETHGTGAPLLLLAGQASDHREWDGMRADFTAHRPAAIGIHMQAATKTIPIEFP
jgi:hypothetical protein